MLWQNEQEGHADAIIGDLVLCVCERLNQASASVPQSMPTERSMKQSPSGVSHSTEKKVPVEAEMKIGQPIYDQEAAKTKIPAFNLY